MAEKLKGYEFPAKGRPQKYEWSVWSDGNPWRLEHGIDFTVAVRTMRTNASAYAKKHGMKVRTAAVDDNKAIIVQFSPAQKG